MPFNISELDALRRKLDRDRRELEERERALAKVEEMLREEMSDSATELHIPAEAPPPIKAEGLTEAVRVAVNAMGVEFTVPEIERYLTAMGTELPKTEPRSRIAMVLQKMREQGLVVRTHAGKGREPHRYRVRGVQP